MQNTATGRDVTRPSSQTTANAGYARVARLAALGRGAELASALRELDASVADAAAVLRAHHVSTVVRGALEGSDASDFGDMREALDAVAPMRAATPDEQLRGFEQVRRLLEVQGIPVL